MKRKKLKKALALILGCILAIAPCAAGKDLPFGMVSHAEVRTASINATSLNVRSGPGTGNQAIARLSQGTTVSVVGETTGSDGKLWYQIQFSGSGGTRTTGYVLGRYVKFPTAITSSADFESYLTSQGFPDSYKPGLRELHAKYPNWTFTAFHTGLDWETAVENESVIGRNLVARDNISSWKSTAAGAYDWDTGTWPGFDGNSWVQASEDIIRYYMDPRNFLNEKYIYQFMDQSYDSSIHTREGLESMVEGTFLSGSVLSGGGSGRAGGSGSSSSGPASGPGMTPTASISAHKTNRVMTTFGPGMSGDPNTSETSSGMVIIPPGTAGGSSSAPGAGSSSGSSSAPGDDSSSDNSAGPGGASPGDGSFGSTSLGGSSSGSLGSGSSETTTYVDILMNAAAQSGVSPYILASMILQEQGSQGTGNSISGTVSGYQGYYNYFNIEAYQSGSMSAVQRGLWWASQSGSYQRPWNSVERSILGGAIYYGSNYVSKGQDTLYLKKFNVQGDNLYKHQYMTNVLAAAAEGMTLAKITALKSMSLEFSIPVYKNMPATACVKPTLDGSPNNKLSGLGVEGFVLTPTFNRDTESYDLIVDPSVASVKVVAAAIDSKATVSGTGTIDLQSGINEVTVSVKAENGHLRNYVLNVIRQSNGPVYSDAIGTNVLIGSSSGPGGGSSSSSSGGSASRPGMGSSGSSGSVVSPGGSSGSSGSSSGSGSGNSGSESSSGSSGSSFSGSQGSDGSGTVISGGSNVVIISPIDGSTSGSSSSSSGSSSGGSSSSDSGNSGSSGNAGPVAPGTVNGYGTESSGSALVGPAGSVVTPGTSGSGSNSGSGQAGAKGDTNGDGKINIMDVLNAQRHILGLGSLTDNAAIAADVNNNNKIDILDVLMMQKHILGIQTLN